MPIVDGTKLGLTTRFRVVVQDADVVDLGGWSTCKGLLAEFKNEPIKEGGYYDSMALMPDRVLYSQITLTRAMNTADSAKVQSWLQKVVREWYSSDSDGSYRDHTAQITLLDAAQAPVMTWTLRNVYPRKWQGPDMDSGSNGRIAIETLVLEHEGFL